MLRSRGQAFSYEFLFVVRAEGFEQQGQVARAKILVHIGNFTLKVWLIALAQASGDKYFVDKACLFGAYGFENGINRLLFGVLNEPTGIDNHDSPLLLVHHVLARCLELAHKYLAVVYVFGTA